MKLKALALALVASATVLPASAADYWFRYGGTAPAGDLSSTLSGSSTARLGSAPTLRMAPLGTSSGYSWSTEGAPPPGLAFSGGSFAGAARAVGTYPLTLVATGLTDGKTAREPVEIRIVPKVAVTGPSTILARIGMPVPANAFEAGGLLGAATLRAEGALPPGIGFSGGSFTGTASAAYDGRPSVVARDDADGAEGSASVTLAVRGLPAVQVGQSLSGTTVSSLSHRLAATGIVGTPSWSTPSGAPAGLSLSPAGIVSGTPSAIGSGSFDVRVSDSVDGARSEIARVAYDFQAATCSFNGTTVRDGQSVTAYQFSDRSCGNVETRTCRNGVLSGSFARSSCEVTLRWTYNGVGSMGMPGLSNSCPSGTCMSRGSEFTCNMRYAGPGRWEYDIYTCK